MNFFESQEQSRRKTRVLLVLMTLAVIAVVGSVTAVIAAATWLNTAPVSAVPFRIWLINHADIVAWTALGVTVFIGCASLYRVAVLREGGSRIARELGGTEVTADDTDSRRRQLRNVVEEMAIASGVPVPGVYVLEQEGAINAFAAGFAPEDAIVAVTQGTLETLSRDELQGVIAHEFSHILNGDMRLNIKLMGPLYGILAIGLVGRMLLHGGRGSRSRRGNGAAAALAIGAGLSIVGYVGLLLGRLIKAGVSRQREYLADASAVQFTRQTAGIAGALKKIAGLTSGSAVQDSEAEEISHMLFASGRVSLASLFNTHPPLLKRIQAIEPRFTETQFEKLHTERATFAATTSAAQDATELARGFAAGEAGPAAGETAHRAGVPADDVVASIGHPTDNHIAAAQALLARIPAGVQQALQTADGVLLVMPAMVLHPSAEKRSRQMTLLTHRMGAARAARISELYAELSELDYTLRLPILELTLPRLKNLPVTRGTFMSELLEELALSDAELELFEYAYLRIYRGYMRAAHSPANGRWRNLEQRDMRVAATLLLQIFVGLTLGNKAEGAAAFARGMASLGLGEVGFNPPRGDWPTAADKALAELNQCTPRGREKLVRALAAAALHDQRINQREGELLRAFCMMLGCPLPPLLANQ